MAKLSESDWENLKADWCTGEYTYRELAEKYGISDAAIVKRKQKEGWEAIPKDVADDYVNAVFKARDSIEKVSKVSKVSRKKLVRALDAVVDTREVMNRVKDNMAKVADVFAASLAERAETTVIESVDDMKPFMAMSQLVNEAMKTPMKMVELETKQPESKETEAEPLSISFEVSPAVGEVKITRHNEQS